MRHTASIAVLSVLLAACGLGAAPADSADSTAKAPQAKSSTAKTGTALGKYDESADAEADVKGALAAAAKDGKPVLVDFGADWCRDCVVLGKLAAKPQVTSLLTKFHVVSVDVGEFDRNLDVADDLTVDLQSSGIPALVVLDAEGNIQTVTNDGSFAKARSMSAGDVAEFLTEWA